MPPPEKSAEQALQEVVYAVSHDMGASVRTVKGFADLLIRRYGEQLDDNGKNFLKLMTKGATDLQAQIDGLLAFSRVTTRGRALAATSVSDIWRSVLASHSERLAEINAIVDQSDLPIVMADEVQMNQHLTELLNNAIKFRRDAPLRLSLSANLCHTESSTLEKFWTFRLTDNGCGIASQHLERVFQIFQRLCPDVSGNGVGLAVCQQIVQRHGGVIWAESELGVGTTICWTLRRE